MGVCRRARAGGVGWPEAWLERSSKLAPDVRGSLLRADFPALTFHLCVR